MAVKWEKVQAGDTLWEVRREKMGNTTMSRWTSRTVRVISIDHAANTAMCSWNGNAPKLWSADRVCKLRRSPHKEG